MRDMDGDITPRHSWFRRITDQDIAAYYDAYGRRIYTYVLTILANAAEAEDVVQHVFASLCGKRSSLGMRHPGAYLMRIARNEALGRLRRRAVRERHAVALQHHLELQALSPEACPNEIRCAIERAICALPPEQREIIALKIFEDMTFAAMAAHLEIPVNTAASRYRYALEKLRSLLIKEGITP